MTYTADIIDDVPLETALIQPTYGPPTAFSFYHLRVTQADGHMAWTCPIRVNAPV